MARYSDSDDDRSYRKKKKHRSRSRSVGSESSHSSRYSKSKKSKKSKQRHRSRSRSRSSERYKRSKRRSVSRDRSRSNSRSRGYKSRRSRSSSRSRRSHSSSRTRSRRSRSRSRSRSKHTSKRGRSRSRSRDRSKRSSPSRSKSSRSSAERQSKKLSDPCSEVEGFDQMTPAEQAKVRMKLALRAAAAADEKLKEMEGMTSAPVAADDPISNTAPLSFEEHQKRIKAIEEIESEDFSPAVFKSGKNASTIKTSRSHSNQNVESTHDNAIFGSGNVITQPTSISGGRIIYNENINLAHPSLYESMEEKMDSWCKKLIEFRRKKLEGDAM